MQARRSHVGPWVTSSMHRIVALGHALVRIMTRGTPRAEQKHY